MNSENVQIIPVAISGAAGQVGRHVCEELERRNIPYLPLNRSLLDLSSLVVEDSYEYAEQRLEKIVPQLKDVRVFINLAAFTAVDAAEEYKDEAYRLNAAIPGLLARYCSQRGIKFFHISTDYVFSGCHQRPYMNPAIHLPTPEAVNVYGLSKWEGERRVAAHNGFIVRTSWVYSAPQRGHSNFLATMCALARKGINPTVVHDQWGRPTEAGALASAIVDLVQQEYVPEITHLAGGGDVITWYEFAREIFAQLGHDAQRVIPIPTREYPTPAVRPMNAALELQNDALPAWHESLQRVLR